MFNKYIIETMSLFKQLVLFFVWLSFCGTFAGFGEFWDKGKGLFNKGKDYFDKGKKWYEKGKDYYKKGKDQFEKGKKHYEEGKKTGKSLYDQFNNFYNSLNEKNGKAIEAAQDAGSFFEDDENANIKLSKQGLMDIFKTTKEKFKKLKDKFDDFKNKTTGKTLWDKIQIGAKTAITVLPDDAVRTIKEAAKNLYNKIQEWLPEPLGKLKNEDLKKISQCVPKKLMDKAKEWTKKIGTQYVQVGKKDNLLPILNTLDIENELNEAYECLYKYLKSLNGKKTFFGKALTNLNFGEAKFFGMNDMTMTFGVSFSGCTLNCGTTTIGFAVSTSAKRQIFHRVSTGIDTSYAIGQSYGFRVGIYKNLESVLGESHIVSFGQLKIKEVNLPIPDLPIVRLDVKADVRKGISLSEIKNTFKGFILNIPVWNKGNISSAFRRGYSLSATKWLNTTKGLKQRWKRLHPQIEFDKYITTLESGGFQAKQMSGLSKELILECPDAKGELNLTGIKSYGMLHIASAGFDIYKDIKTDKCNPIKVFENIKNECETKQKCTIKVEKQYLLESTCGKTFTKDNGELNVVFRCRRIMDVFPMGCFDVSNSKNQLLSLEKKDELVKGDYKKRINPIARCGKVAHMEKYKGFGITDSGKCIGLKDFSDMTKFNKKPKEQCTSTIGNENMMYIYTFAPVVSTAMNDAGCIPKDRLINILHPKNMENQHFLTKDQAQNRDSITQKCAQIAQNGNYPGFALFEGGNCYVGKDLKKEKILPLREANYSGTCGMQYGTANSFQVFTFDDHNNQITIVPNQNQGDKAQLKLGAIIAIIFGSILFVSLVIFGIVCFIKKRKETKSNHYSEMNDKLNEENQI